MKNKRSGIYHSQKNTIDGNTQHIKDFDNGYYIVQIKDTLGLEHESASMSHCIKTYNLDSYDVYSLRKNNKSLVTFCFSKDNKSFQMKSAYNELVKEEFLSIVIMWLIEQFSGRKMKYSLLLKDTTQKDDILYISKNKYSWLSKNDILNTIDYDVGILIGVDISLTETLYNQLTHTLHMQKIDIIADSENPKIIFDGYCDKFKITLDKQKNIDVNFINTHQQELTLTVDILNSLDKVSLTSISNNINFKHSFPIENVEINVSDYGQIKCYFESIYAPKFILNSDTNSAIMLSFKRCDLNNMTYQKDMSYIFDNCIHLNSLNLSGRHVSIRNMELTEDINNIDVLKLISCNVDSIEINTETVFLNHMEISPNIRFNVKNIHYDNCTKIFIPKCEYVQIVKCNVYHINVKNTNSISLKSCSTSIDGIHSNMSVALEDGTYNIYDKNVKLKSLSVYSATLTMHNIHCQYMTIGQNTNFICNDIFSENSVMIALTQGHKDYVDDIVKKIKLNNLYCKGNILFYIIYSIENNITNFEYNSIHAEWHILSPYQELVDDTAICLNKINNVEQVYLQLNTPVWKQNTGITHTWFLNNIPEYHKYIIQNDGLLYCRYFVLDISHINISQNINISTDNIRIYMSLKFLNMSFSINNHKNTNVKIIRPDYLWVVNSQLRNKKISFYGEKINEINYEYEDVPQNDYRFFDYAGT